MDTNQSWDHASGFLQLLDPDLTARFNFRTLSAGARNKYSGTLSEHWASLVRDNNTGLDVFVVVNAGGHRKSEIERVRGLFVDQDKPDGRTWQSLYGIGRDPHCTVSTSPGKFHSYWLVDDAFPLGRFRSTQQALAAEYGTDPAVCDLSRVMRLPGFLHRKRDPYLSHIVAWNPSLPRYSVDAFPAASLPVPVVEDRPMDELCALAEYHGALDRLARATHGNRNSTVNASAYALGRLVPGLFTRQHMEAQISERISTWDDDESGEFERAMRSGLDAGTLNPRSISRSLIMSATTPAPCGVGGVGGIQPAASVNLMRADQIAVEPVDWLWNGYLAAGKLHLVAGSPGTGKTTAAISLSAILSRGGVWPDGTRAPLADVIAWSGEDDLKATLVPRAMACGADLSRVHFIDGLTVAGERQAFDPAVHVYLLEQALDRVPGAKMLIVDPVVSAVAGDSHKNAEVRRALQPLVDLAERRGIAVLGVTHLSKGTAGRSPAERVTGSLAFVALARIVLVAARKEDEGGEPVHMLVRTKSNIGPSNGGFAYRLTFPELAPGVIGSCVHWGEPLEGNAREILRNAEEDEDEAGSRSEAKEWLAQQLANGPIPSKQLAKDGKEAGHAWRTLERAKKEVRAKTRKNDSGIWEWYLLPTPPANLSPPNCPLLSSPPTPPSPPSPQSGGVVADLP